MAKKQINKEDSSTNSSSTGFISNPFKVVLRGFSNVFESNPNPTLILLAISIILSIFGGFGRLGVNTNETANVSATIGVSSTVLLLVVWLVGIVVDAMAWLLGIQSAKGKSHHLGEFFQHAMRHFWQLIGFYIIYAILVVIGLVFFIVPGILFLYWFSLTPLVILDQNKGIFESMEISRKMIKGLFWEWVGVGVVASVFSLGGILSVPIQGGGFGLFYQQIKNLRDKDASKPPTHWANYLVLILGVILLIGVFAAFGFWAILSIQH